MANQVSRKFFVFIIYKLLQLFRYTVFALISAHVPINAPNRFLNSIYKVLNKRPLLMRTNKRRKTVNFDVSDCVFFINGYYTVDGIAI